MWTNRAQEARLQQRSSRALPAKWSVQGTRAHSCWPEGSGDASHPAPAAPKKAAAPPQHLPPLLPRKGYEPGEGGGSEAAQIVGKAITTAHPHDASIKGDDASPVLKGLTSSPRASYRKKSAKCRRRNSSAAWKVLCSPRSDENPNAPQFQQVTALSSALTQASGSFSGLPDPLTPWCGKLCSSSAPQLGQSRWESACARFSLLRARNSQPTIYRVTFSF